MLKVFQPRIPCIKTVPPIFYGVRYGKLKEGEYACGKGWTEGVGREGWYSVYISPKCGEKSLKPSLSSPSFTCIYHVIWSAWCRESCLPPAGYLLVACSPDLLPLEELPCDFMMVMFKKSFRYRFPQVEKHHHCSGIPDVILRVLV